MHVYVLFTYLLQSVVGVWGRRQLPAVTGERVCPGCTQPPRPGGLLSELLPALLRLLQLLHDNA